MLWRRSASAVVVVLVAVIPALFGGWVLIALLVTAGLIGLEEVARALGHKGYSVYPWLSRLLLLTVLLATVARSSTVLLLCLSAVVLVPLARGITSDRHAEALANAAMTSLAVLYLALPLGAAGLLRGMSGEALRGWLQAVAEFVGSRDTSLGLAWFLWGLSVTWLTDTAAYLYGSRFGHTKLVPRLSPGKTREGALAGLCAGSLTGGVGAALFGLPLSPWLALAAGLLVSLIAQIGDLAESLIKRAVGIKDMGHFIPGHGGLVDRIDALLFTLPLTLALATLVAEVPSP